MRDLKVLRPVFILHKCAAERTHNLIWQECGQSGTDCADAASGGTHYAMLAAVVNFKGCGFLVGHKAILRFVPSYPL